MLLSPRPRRPRPESRLSPPGGLIESRAGNDSNVSSLTRAGLLGALVFAAAALTGCGGSSSHAEQKKDVTAPAYGVVPATTESVSPVSDRACQQNAQGLADNALPLLD